MKISMKLAKSCIIESESISLMAKMAWRSNGVAAASNISLGNGENQEMAKSMA